MIINAITLIAWLVASALDIKTTNDALARPSTRESNPVVEWQMRRFGDRWAHFNFALSLIAGVAIIASYDAGYITVAILAAIRALVAWRNTKV